MRLPPGFLQRRHRRNPNPWVQIPGSLPIRQLQPLLIRRAYRRYLWYSLNR